MRAFDSAAGWGWVSRALHWAMAALILFQLGFGLYMTRLVPDLLARFTLTQTHKSWGTVDLRPGLLRVAWRLANRGPPAAAAGDARAGRPAPPAPATRLLYLFMFVMPLSGWLLASASPVQDLLQMQNLVFGRLPLPDPFVPGVRRHRGRRPPRRTPPPPSASRWSSPSTPPPRSRHQFVDRDGLLARMLWRP